MTLLLKNRALVLLGIAESVSNMGNWLTMMAVFALVVFREEGGVAESSAIMLAGLGPMLLFSPLAGWLCDRFNRKWLMIASQLLSALPVLALFFAESLSLVYVLIALQSVFSALMSPARQAVVPALVSHEELTRANAFLQQLSSLVKIGAPIAGGVLVAALGPQRAMLLDVISFGVAALLLCWLPSLPAVPAAQAREEERDSTPSSLRVVFAEAPMLRLLFVSMFLAITVIMGFDVLGPIYVRDVLAAQADFFGLLIGLVGLGSVGSVAWLMLRKQERHPWDDLLLGLLFLACIPLFLALGYWLHNPAAARVLTAIGLLLGGLGNGLTNVQVGTLLQQLAPRGLLGRIGGLFQSVIVAGQLIAILTTPLLVPSVLSIGLYFVLSAFALLLVGFAIFQQLQRARRLQPVAVGD